MAESVLIERAGACFPVFAARHKGTGVPDWAFFIAKYFGSGIIIATAFIHVSQNSDLILNTALPILHAFESSRILFLPFSFVLFLSLSGYG